MIIKRAEKMGFCFGVSGAVDLCEEVIKKNNISKKKMYILGMLVHNKVVIKDMEDKGFEVLKEEDLLSHKIHLGENDLVIVRAHGTTKEIYKTLDESGCEIFDATCVFVKRIRNALIEAENKGNKIIFVGDKNHPEVKGILSFGNNFEVVASFEEFLNFKVAENKGNKIIFVGDKNHPEVKGILSFGNNFEVVASFEEFLNFKVDSNVNYTLLTQTTFNKEVFFKIKDYILENYNNIEIFSKICGATYERQRAVEKLAKECEAIIIVGDKKSSNSKKLYEISKEINEKSYLIEEVDQLNIDWLKNISSVGITAGASTPEKIEISKEINEKSYLIEEVDQLNIDWLKNISSVGITAGASTPEKIIIEIEKFIRGNFDDKHGL